MQYNSFRFVAKQHGANRSSHYISLLFTFRLKLFSLSTPSRQPRRTAAAGCRFSSDYICMFTSILQGAKASKDHQITKILLSSMKVTTKISYRGHCFLSTRIDSRKYFGLLVILCGNPCVRVCFKMINLRDCTKLSRHVSQNLQRIA